MIALGFGSDGARRVTGADFHPRRLAASKTASFSTLAKMSDSENHEGGKDLFLFLPSEPWQCAKERLNAVVFIRI